MLGCTSANVAHSTGSQNVISDALDSDRSPDCGGHGRVRPPSTLCVMFMEGMFKMPLGVGIA